MAQCMGASRVGGLVTWCLSPASRLGFRGQGSGFRVKGSGFRVQSSWSGPSLTPRELQVFGNPLASSQGLITCFLFLSLLMPREWKVSGNPLAIGGLEFGVQGSGHQGSGFRVQGSGCRVQGSEFRFQGSGLRVWVQA